MSTETKVEAAKATKADLTPEEKAALVEEFIGVLHEAGKVWSFVTATEAMNLAIREHGGQGKVVVDKLLDLAKRGGTTTPDASWGLGSDSIRQHVETALGLAMSDRQKKRRLREIAMNK